MTKNKIEKLNYSRTCNNHQAHALWPTINFNEFENIQLNYPKSLKHKGGSEWKKLCSGSHSRGEWITRREHPKNREKKQTGRTKKFDPTIYDVN